MDLFESFYLKVNQSPGYQNKVKLLLAVSGGVDSVVLCNLVYKAGYNFAIAHCNFELRGKESDEDEAFVRDLASQYNKEIFVERFETEKYAAQNKIAIQEAARKLRYAWFWKLADENHAVITTAHHADDNIETAAINFFRGTGLKGLTGMDGKFPVYRPLLSFRKNQVIEYAKENSLHFREDSTNASNKYTRNFFRNELLPAIKEVFPSAEENILQNIERLTEVEQVYEEAIKHHKAKLIEVKGNEEHIPILKLKKVVPLRTILWEIIKEKHFTAAQIDEVIKLMDADNGSYITSPSYRIIKNRKWLIITSLHSNESQAHFIIDALQENKKHFKQEGLLIEKIIISANFKIPADQNIACFDSDKITFPLLLRKWKQGDYFYPLGMKKKKKLSRFFIDQKLSLTAKENVWVLEMNRKIIWVTGLRIDDRFKIEPGTKNVLAVTRC